MQMKHAHVKHPPPPLPPRNSDTSPQPAFMVQVPSAGVRDTKFNNNSYQTTQSYQAYDPRNAVPTTATSRRPVTTRPSSDLAAENAELTEQLRAMRIECDEKTTAVDNMVTAIVESESLLAEKEEEIARLSAELEQKTPKFSKMEELFNKRQAEALKEKERKITALQEEVNRLSTSAWTTDTSPAEKHNAELSDLRQRSAGLQKQLAEKEDQLGTWESGWQSHMQKEKEKLETAIESKYFGLHSELREQTSRREEAEARLRDLETKQSTMEDAGSRAADGKVTAALAQVEFQKSQSETYLQQLRDLKDANAALSQQIAGSSKAQIDTAALDQLKAELEESRRLANFFKKNSEQTSKNIKEVASANRALEEAIAAKTMEVDEQNSLIQAMKMQLGDMGRQYSAY